MNIISNDSLPISNDEDPFVIGSKKFSSRLLVGTGKYTSAEETRQVIENSGAEIVTVSLRRVNIDATNSSSIADIVDSKKYTYLPNSAGCFNANDAVRTLRLSRELGGWNMVKLEVLGDKNTLYPNMVETLKAAEILVEDGFDVMAYCSDDPILCKSLEKIGCKAVMPLAAPIGSGLGILNPLNIKIIAEESNVPVLVDAGIGTASDAAMVMELGCDGVLLNTALAEAKNPVLMAKAMKNAVNAGRMAYLAGRMSKKNFADASSPKEGII